MQRYILGRIIQSILCVFFISIAVFFVIRLAGDPVVLLIPADATPEDVAMLTSSLGLDKPLPVQYWIFISHAVTGDLGTSLRGGRSVMELILQRLPYSLLLGGVAMLFTVVVALPLGVYAAVRRGTTFDYIVRVFAVLGQSAPVFWTGLMLMLIFGVWLRILPAGGWSGPRSLILPAVTMAGVTMAGLMRLTRSSMLDVLSSEYVKMARIKGVSEPMVIWKHALKNALLPVVTLAVIMFVMSLTGAVVIEVVFAWPGMARLLMESLPQRDYPVIQGVVFLLSILYIGGNLLADVLYAYLNPRIRYQR